MPLRIPVVQPHTKAAWHAQEFTGGPAYVAVMRTTPSALGERLASLPVSSRTRSTALLWLVLTALAMLLAACTSAPAESGIAGRVVAVKDGDTLELLTADKRLYTIRLAEIDAPEKGQPYGQKAKQVLSDLCFGQEVTTRTVAIDRYGRTVARVYRGNTDINAELVRVGAVWLYRKHLTDRSLIALEEEARASRQGLWALPEREQVPPWEWRHRR